MLHPLPYFATSSSVPYWVRAGERALRALELTQQVMKPVVLLPCAPAFLNRRVALARQRAHQCTQGVEIIRKRIDRHDDI